MRATGRRSAVRDRCGWPTEGHHRVGRRMCHRGLARRRVEPARPPVRGDAEVRCEETRAVRLHEERDPRRRRVARIGRPANCAKASSPWQRSYACCAVSKRSGIASPATWAEATPGASANASEALAPENIPASPPFRLESCLPCFRELRPNDSRHGALAPPNRRTHATSESNGGDEACSWWTPLGFDRPQTKSRATDSL